MRWGTENEPNAVNTLVSFVIPTLFPNLTFFEEGKLCEKKLSIDLD